MRGILIFLIGFIFLCGYTNIVYSLDDDPLWLVGSGGDVWNGNVSFTNTITDENLNVILNGQAQVEANTSMLLHMNEGSGNYVNDSSPNGNNGSIYGATWTTGKFGSALSFDGINDYVDVGNDLSIRIGNNTDFTVAVWMKRKTLAANTNYALVGQTINPVKWWFVGVRNNKIYTWWDDDVALSSGYQSDTLAINTWYHIIIVHEEGVGYSSYIDGDFYNIVSDNDDISSAYNVRMGAYLGGAFFNGTIDEGAIFNRALSASEIADLYNNTYPSSGNTTSIEKDAENILGNQSGDVWKQIMWNGSVTTGTNVSIYINTSSDNVTYSATLVKDNADPGVAYNVPISYQKRYGSWILELKTNDSSKTPIVGNVTFITGDVTPPQITVHSPINITYFTTSIDLNVSADETIDTWIYNLNNGGNTSFIPNETVAAIEGSNNIIIYANDTSGNLNTSTVYFTVADTTAPTIAIASPQNQTYELGTAITLTYGASEAVDTVTDVYQLDGGNNTSFTNGTTQITSGVGSHSLTVWAQDTSGNWGTSTVYFTVADTTAPTIAIASPQNQTYENTSTPSITYDADETIDTNMYSIDGAAPIPFDNDTTTLNLSSLVLGQHNITIYANDTAGNWGNDTRWFTIVYTPPPAYSLTWLPPISLTSFTINKGSTLPIKFNVTDGSGNFVADENITVTIYNITNTTPSVYVTYNASGNGSRYIRIDLEEEYYIVNFHTKPYFVGTYRVEATTAAGTIGIKEVDIVVKKGKSKG